MSRFIQGDCLGHGDFVGKNNQVKYIFGGVSCPARDAPSIIDCLKYRTNSPWKQNANVADVLPSAAHTANRAIERMISQALPT